MHQADTSPFIEEPFEAAPITIHLRLDGAGDRLMPSHGAHLFQDKVRLLNSRWSQ